MPPSMWATSLMSIRSRSDISTLQIPFPGRHSQHPLNYVGHNTAQLPKPRNRWQRTQSARQASSRCAGSRSGHYEPDWFPALSGESAKIDLYLPAALWEQKSSDKQTSDLKSIMSIP